MIKRMKRISHLLILVSICLYMGNFVGSTNYGYVLFTILLVDQTVDSHQTKNKTVDSHLMLTE